jgi:hypothetical protein
MIFGKTLLFVVASIGLLGPVSLVPEPHPLRVF